MKFWLMPVNQPTFEPWVASAYDHLALQTSTEKSKGPVGKESAGQWLQPIRFNHCFGILTTTGVACQSTIAHSVKFFHSCLVSMDLPCWASCDERSAKNKDFTYSYTYWSHLAFRCNHKIKWACLEAAELHYPNSILPHTASISMATRRLYRLRQRRFIFSTVYKSHIL